MEKILNRLEKLLLLLSGVLLAVMILSITWQVILRYGFHNANAWSEELARYCMVLIVMLTAPIGLRKGKHVRVDFFVEMMPKSMQKVVDVLVDILMMVYMVGLMKSALTLMANPSKQYSPGLHIDMMLMYGAIALGSVLMLIFMVDTMYQKYWKPRHTGQEKGEAT